MASPRVTDSTPSESLATATILVCESGDRWLRALTARRPLIESACGAPLLLRSTGLAEVARIAPRIQPLVILWELDPTLKNFTDLAQAIYRLNARTDGPLQVAALGLGWDDRDANRAEIPLVLRQLGAGLVVRNPEDLVPAEKLIARFLLRETLRVVGRHAV